MKSIDTVVESFKLIFKNPKILWIQTIELLLSLILVFSVAFFLSSSIVESLHSSIAEWLHSSSNLTSTDLFMSWISKNISFILFIIFIFVIIFILIESLFTGAMISAGIQATKGKVSILKAFKESKKKYLSLLGVSLISDLAFVGFFIFLILLLLLGYSLLGHTGLILFLFLDLVFFFVFVTLLIIGFFQSNVVIFTENKKAIDAIKRSFGIAKKKWPSILAVLFFSLLISFAIGLILNILRLPFSFFGVILKLIFVILIQFPVSIFLESVKEILPVVFYYNYKIKKL